MELKYMKARAVAGIRNPEDISNIPSMPKNTRINFMIDLKKYAIAKKRKVFLKYLIPL